MQEDTVCAPHQSTGCRDCIYPATGRRRLPRSSDSLAVSPQSDPTSPADRDKRYGKSGDIDIFIFLSPGLPIKWEAWGYHGQDGNLDYVQHFGVKTYLAKNVTILNFR